MPQAWSISTITSEPYCGRRGECGREVEVTSWTVDTFILLCGKSSRSVIVPVICICYKNIATDTRYAPGSLPSRRRGSHVRWRREKMISEVGVFPRVLIIDDDKSLLESYTVLLEDEFQ